LRLADFAFHVGNNDDPTTWTTAPAPSGISVRRGAGVDSSDRVTILWPDGAIQGQWLQVTVLATAATGLAASDVFYFGNAIGETGNSPSDARVDAVDVLMARNHPRTFVDPAPIDFPYDFNRDGRVNATDMLLARNNQTGLATALRLIDPRVGKSGAPMPAPGRKTTWAAARGPLPSPVAGEGLGVGAGREEMQDSYLSKRLAKLAGIAARPRGMVT
jgi:hypothetical protein